MLCLFSALSLQDLEYINKKLNKSIKNDFLQLSNYEKKHSVLVAQAVEREIKDDPDLVLAALLHDIGKVKHHINIIEKSILVILDYLTKGNLKKYNKNKSINIFYNHGEIGYDILKNTGCNERILYLIKNHHNKSIKSDDLNVIRKFDDIY